MLKEVKIVYLPGEYAYIYFSFYASVLFSVVSCNSHPKAGDVTGGKSYEVTFSWEAITRNETPAIVVQGYPCGSDCDTSICMIQSTSRSNYYGHYDAPGERFKPRY